MEKIITLYFTASLILAYIVTASLTCLAIQGLVYQLSGHKINIYKGLNKLWKKYVEEEEIK